MQTLKPNKKATMQATGTLSPDSPTFVQLTHTVVGCAGKLL